MKRAGRSSFASKGFVKSLLPRVVVTLKKISPG
jgi:hypothetical protein